MIIYTCITNSYDVIPDHYYDPDVRYVLFHDGTAVPQEPWELIELDVDVDCPRRLSAYPKINPHKYFDEGENTVWIDGCYIMTKEFVELAKQRFPFTILRHPNRFSYYDEMLEGFECSFFGFREGIELTRILFEDGYNFRDYRSPLGTIIYRTINDDTITHSSALASCGSDRASVGNRESSPRHCILAKNKWIGSPRLDEDQILSVCRQ